MKYRRTKGASEMTKSPPSRGAWIEIRSMRMPCRTVLSPPSRGAWIEISLLRSGRQEGKVAPLTGGVD